MKHSVAQQAYWVDKLLLPSNKEASKVIKKTRDVSQAKVKFKNMFLVPSESSRVQGSDDGIGLIGYRLSAHAETKVGAP